jgi:probable HAF family extracellular repeat protein
MARNSVVKRFRSLAWLASVAVVAAALPAQAQFQPYPYRYVVTGTAITDLGALGGANSAAFDINNTGNITGWADNWMGNRRAFLFTAGVMLDLDPAHPSTTSEARGINNHDQIVGVFTSPNGTHAFRWAAGGFLQLNDFIPANLLPIRSVATAISDGGVAVGEIRAEFPETAAVLWTDPAAFQILAGGATAFSDFASDINAQGVAVGFDTNLELPRRWRLSGPQVISEEIPRPNPGYDETSARPRGINSAGQVVGYASCCRPQSPYSLRAWYWDGVSATATDLGLLPSGTMSVAEDINDGGFIVGYADRSVPRPPFFTVNVESPFLFHPHFGMVQLPLPSGSSSLRACRAHALNEKSSAGIVQVVGYCATRFGSRAIRWDVSVALVYGGEFLPGEPFLP